ncbi:MAG: hemerythrin family protein [Deltaproteobacteria bacterium]|nr:hemerythrin family protein [Deltaproteobacteria bacterium]
MDWYNVLTGNEHGEFHKEKNGGFKQRKTYLKEAIMSALSWKKNLETGIEWQDSEHQELFGKINALLDAMLGCRDEEEVFNLVKLLDSSMQVHFRAEEQVMGEIDYTERNAHNAEHVQFKKLMLKIKRDLIEGISPEHIFKTQQKTIEWFLNHIRKSDKKLGEFIKSRAAA